MSSSETWVEVRRFDDAVSAHLLCELLRAQGIPAAVRGSGSGSGIFTRFAAVVDLRVVVPQPQLLHARAALRAFDSGELERELPPELAPGSAPYRDRLDPDERPRPLRRSSLAAALLALLVPVGGGHFYTRHHGAAFALAGGILALTACGVALDAPWLFLAALLVVLADALLAPLAARRFNAQRVPSNLAQVPAGLAVVAAAAGLAWVLTGGERGPAQEPPATPLRTIAR